MNAITGNFDIEKRLMPKYLILSNSNEIVRILPDRIAYVSADGNYCTMVLIDGEKHMFSFNLATFERHVSQQLHSGIQTLVRLGRELIVNKKHIYYINVSRQKLILLDNHFKTRFELDASKEVLRDLKTDFEDEVSRYCRI